MWCTKLSESNKLFLRRLFEYRISYKLLFSYALPPLFFLLTSSTILLPFCMLFFSIHLDSSSIFLTTTSSIPLSPIQFYWLKTLSSLFQSVSFHAFFLSLQFSVFACPQFSSQAAALFHLFACILFLLQSFPFVCWLLL